MKLSINQFSTGTDQVAALTLSGRYCANIPGANNQYHTYTKMFSKIQCAKYEPS